MALIIPNYKEPGAYSTIIPNPTTATASGPPIVAILGPALQGTYEPSLFFNADDAQHQYGIATKSNPLPLGIQIAFENGAKQVLGINVQPSNSTVAFFDPLLNGKGMPIATVGAVTSTFPATGYRPADLTLLDPVSGVPVNTDGTVAGVFYVQDFDPLVADPVLNSSPASTNLQFVNSFGNLLQYIKYCQAPFLNGSQQVPYMNSSMVRIQVPAVQNIGSAPTATPSLSANVGPQATDAQWTQLNNALVFANAINSALNSPLVARILVPDYSSSSATNQTPNYREMYSALNQFIQPTSNGPVIKITSTADLYSYAVNFGFMHISAIEPGKEHEIIAGLFATQSYVADPTDATGKKLLPFGINVSQYAGPNNTNPTFYFFNGADGVVTAKSYIDAINNELTTVRADVIVVLNTDSTLNNTIQDHCALMSSHDERNERIAIVSGGVSELYTTTIANVQAIQQGSAPERMVYIWPTGGYRQDPVQRTTVVLDGSFLAAACAGILCSNDAAEPLTRKRIAGFSDVSVKTSRTQKNLIARNGITIIENDPRAGLRVRDGITCNPSTPETQEISVVRQLDFTAQNVRDLLDDNIVATKITQNTLPVVQTLTKNKLQSLVDAKIIYGFKDVSARINPLDPRQIDVRFTVRPAYPCKYIEIVISVTSALDGF